MLRVYETASLRSPLTIPITCACLLTVAYLPSASYLPYARPQSHRTE